MECFLIYTQSAGQPCTVPRIRSGVDSTDRWPHMPSQYIKQWLRASYDIGDADNPDVVAVYNFADEEFDQQATSLFYWDISDALSGFVI